MINEGAFIAAFIFSLVVGVIFGWLVYFLCCINERDTTYSYKHRWAITIIFVIIVATAGGFIGSNGAGNQWTTIQPIASLNDDSSISGRFMLGSGSIDEDPVYVYYSVEQDGGMMLRTLKADNAKIYEDSNEPYLKVFNTQMVFGNVYQKYEFHVPNDTVVRYYNLDSKLRG
jgi:heme/copper-type cytochrome/quinol oxidase subunit 2